MEIYFKLLIPLMILGFAECKMYNLIGMDDVLVALKSVNVTVRHAKEASGHMSIMDFSSSDYNLNGTTDNKENAKVIVTLPPKESGDLKIEGVTLNLDFVSKNGYWSLKNITSTFNGKFKGEPINLDDMVMISGIELVAPKGKSFHCDRFGSISPASTKTNNEKLAKTNYTFSAEFFQFQIQTFGLEKVKKFGMSYECQGFFSIGIWSGIFISAFLIAILTWGICMIMSVKTMDRFDDPKGKQISFGSND